LPPAPSKKPTGRKPGGQPGHPPHLRQLLAPERVHQFVPFVPATCVHCAAPLSAQAGPHDPEPTRHQVAELPPVAAIITEYQGQARTCSCCGQVTRAAIPAAITQHSIGPQLTGVIGYLAGDQGISKRGVEEIVEHVLGVPIALGTIANLEQEVSAALAGAHAEATQAVSVAPVKHVDETGWKLKGLKRWLWAAATRVAAVFIIHPQRNLSALKMLLDQRLTGILCSDRWVVYADWPEPFDRQLCWAHLKRNWETMVERGGAARRIGERFLAIHRQVFEAWHLFRGGGCTRPQLGARIEPLMEVFMDVLEAGMTCRDAKTRRFCARLEAEQFGLWTFASIEGVEPTNNHGERVLRRAVIWRRRSFGSASAAGCRFAERILTVATTLRLQKRNIVNYLGECIAAFRAGQITPKLIMAG
jgi:transposase